MEHKRRLRPQLGSERESAVASSTSLDSAVGAWRISFILAVPDLNRSVKEDEAIFNLSMVGLIES